MSGNFSNQEKLIMMNQFKLTELSDKFQNTGMKGHSVISDKELKEYYFKLAELEDFMLYRKDSTMAFAFRMECDRVNQMYFNRTGGFID